MHTFNSKLKAHIDFNLPYVCRSGFTHTLMYLFNLRILSFIESNHLKHTYLHLSAFDDLNFKPSRACPEPCLSSLLFKKPWNLQGLPATLPAHPSAGLFCFKRPDVKLESSSNFSKAACKIGSGIKKQHFVCVYRKETRWM